MTVLDVTALRATALNSDPFDHLVVPAFIKADDVHRIVSDYPAIGRPRNYRLDELRIGGAFERMVDELRGAEFEAAISEKFGVSLEDKVTAITVRGLCERSDGNIHTDSKTKIITVLIYFNREWPHEGGRLRLLRSANDIEDYVEEVAPLAGTLLAFRRCDHSYHGHRTFEGSRLMLQLSWVEPKRTANYRSKRDGFGWRLKRFLGISSGGRLRTN
jgi:SM-20-related protein